MNKWDIIDFTEQSDTINNIGAIGTLTLNGTIVAELELESSTLAWIATFEQDAQNEDFRFDIAKWFNEMADADNLDEYVTNPDYYILDKWIQFKILGGKDAKEFFKNLS